MLINNRLTILTIFPTAKLGHPMFKKCYIPKKNKYIALAPQK